MLALNFLGHMVLMQTSYERNASVFEISIKQFLNSKCFLFFYFYFFCFWVHSLAYSPCTTLATIFANFLISNYTYLAVKGIHLSDPLQIIGIWS